MSGFYEEDLPMISGVAAQAGLEFLKSDSMDKWCCAQFRKG